jgi:hypothetical protein
MKPKVSICVPNLNTRPFLPERFETIFSQSFQDWELLVYDSYSEDGAWKYIQELAAREERMALWGLQIDERSSGLMWAIIILRALLNYRFWPKTIISWLHKLQNRGSRFSTKWMLICHLKCIASAWRREQDHWSKSRVTAVWNLARN